MVDAGATAGVDVSLDGVDTIVEVDDGTTASCIVVVIVIVGVIIVVDETDSVEITPLVKLSRKVVACVLTIALSDVDDAIFVLSVVNGFVLVVGL